jgi:DNA-binding NarL/FixJ family response regulator
MSIGILIADDQALVRRGFRMILEIEPDLEVLGDAVDGDDAIAQSRILQPDIVLMDVRMPGTDGIEATQRILADPMIGEGTRIVMLTTFDMDQYVYDALRAGASGFLLKDAQPELLVLGHPLGACRRIAARAERHPADDRIFPAAGAGLADHGGQARAPHTPRVRDPEAPRSRPHQHRDRTRALRVRDDGEDARRPRAREARAA